MFHTQHTQVGFKMMAYPAIPDKARGTPIKVRVSVLLQCQMGPSL